MSPDKKIKNAGPSSNVFSGFRAQHCINFYIFRALISLESTLGYGPALYLYIKFSFLKSQLWCHQWWRITNFIIMVNSVETIVHLLDNFPFGLKSSFLKNGFLLEIRIICPSFINSQNFDIWHHLRESGQTKGTTENGKMNSVPVEFKLEIKYFCYPKLTIDFAG